jgi:hypothetical protein
MPTTTPTTSTARLAPPSTHTDFERTKEGGAVTVATPRSERSDSGGRVGTLGKIPELSMLAITLARTKS